MSSEKGEIHEQRFEQIEAAGLIASEGVEKYG